MEIRGRTGTPTAGQRSYSGTHKQRSQARPSPAVTTTGRTTPGRSTVTPRGALVTTGGADAAWTDTFRGRLQSLSRLRMQLEDLADSHKKEEVRFIESMKILMRSRGQKDPEIDHALIHDAEREKIQALEMFSLFKRQGGEIITELKGALQEASDRCAALEAENLTMRRVVEQHGGSAAQIADALRTVATQGRVEDLERRIHEYRALLEEEDQIIQELQHRNKALEAKGETLRQQRDKLLDVDSTKSVSFQQDYNDVMAALRLDPEEVPRDPIDRLALQQKLIQMLTSKLKAEQRERLRIEEQGARMAAEQEKMMRKFDARAKDVDTTTNKSPSPKHNAKTTTAPPTATSERRKEGRTHHAAVAATPAVVVRAVSPPQLTLPPLQPMLSPGGGIRSLEAQLADVAKDLNSSLDMWAAKLSTSDAWSSLTEGKVKVPPLPIPSSGIPAAAGDMLTASSEDDSSARLVRPMDDTEYLPESPSTATAQRHGSHDFSPTSPAS